MKEGAYLVSHMHQVPSQWSRSEDQYGSTMCHLNLALQGPQCKVCGEWGKVAVVYWGLLGFMSISGWVLTCDSATSW